jgi:Tfp pilus assembly protein PilF
MNRLYRILYSLILAVIFGLGIHSPSADAYSLHSASKAEDYLSLATENIQHHDYSPALQALNQAIKLDDTLAEAYSDRCWVHIQLENYPEAIEVML